MQSGYQLRDEKHPAVKLGVCLNVFGYRLPLVRYYTPGRGGTDSGGSGGVLEGATGAGVSVGVVATVAADTGAVGVKPAGIICSGAGAKVIGSGEIGAGVACCVPALMVTGSGLGA